MRNKARRDLPGEANAPASSPAGCKQPGCDTGEHDVGQQPGWLQAAGLRRACIVLLLAGLVRGVVLVALFGHLRQDPDAYREIAENLLAHGSFALDVPADERAKVGAEYRATAYRPPLYPLVLAAASVGNDAVSPLRVAALHWMLGVATVLLVWRLGARLGLGWRSFVATALVALDPILLNQSALVMTETLATLLAVLCLFGWLRLVEQPGVGRALVVGALVGLAGLCRPTFLPWLGFLGLVVLVAPSLVGGGERATTSRRLGLVVALGLGAVALLLPWGARNYLVLGRPIVTTTHGGYTLLLGNNPAYYDYLRNDETSLPWPADDPAFQRLLPGKPPPVGDELKYDATTKQIAWQAMRDQPGMFLRATLNRVRQLWSPLPNPLSVKESAARRLLRWCVAAWYLVVFTLALVGLGRLGGQVKWAAWLGAVLLCLTFTLMHSLYWSNLRMRAPLVPAVALLAVAGLQGRRSD